MAFDCSSKPRGGALETTQLSLHRKSALGMNIAWLLSLTTGTGNNAMHGGHFVRIYPQLMQFITSKIILNPTVLTQGQAGKVSVLDCTVTGLCQILHYCRFLYISSILFIFSYCIDCIQLISVSDLTLEVVCEPPCDVLSGNDSSRPSLMKTNHRH